MKKLTVAIGGFAVMGSVDKFRNSKRGKKGTRDWCMKYIFRVLNIYFLTGLSELLIHRLTAYNGLTLFNVPPARKLS